MHDSCVDAESARKREHCIGVFVLCATTSAVQLCLKVCYISYGHGIREHDALWQYFPMVNYTA